MDTPQPRVAVVTGGASGIGRATVARLAADGFLRRGAGSGRDGRRGQARAAGRRDRSVRRRAGGRPGRRDLRPDRRAGEQRRHLRFGRRDGLPPDADRRVGPGPGGQRPRPVPVYPGGPADHACPGQRARDHGGVDRRAGRVPGAERVHRVEGCRGDVHQVAGGRLRRGGHPGERGLPGHGRDADDPVAPRPTRAASSGGGEDPARAGWRNPRKWRRRSRCSRPTAWCT